MTVISEVKQRTDIVDVVSQYVALKKAGRNLSGLCPFHSEKHPSFFVYPEQQSWHCFGCNTGGDVFSFVMKKENIDFGDVLRLLAQKAGVTIPSKFEREEGKGEKERLYQINEAATQYFHNLLLTSPTAEKARSYVASRGFSAKTITDFQLGFSLNSWESLKQYLLERDYTESELLTAGLLVETEDGKTHDRFRNKLIFPILDIRGRVIGFGARVLDDSLPKYVNSPQTPLFDKSGSLYGINLASSGIRQQETAVIVEGYIDTITAHQNGFNNVVASMGTSVTEKQVSSLKKLTKNIILALDADAAGEEAMLRGVDYENTIGAEVRVIILPKDKDPDDVIKDNPETWQQLLSEAMPVVDYTINIVTAKLDLTTAKDKSLAVDRLLPIIAQIKDNIRRDHYLQKLAKLIGTSYNNIEATLKAYLVKSKTREPKVEAVTRTVRSLVSNPIEEYCLALLLQHPELKGSQKDFSPEYFENSENREIFTVWQQANNLSSLKKKLDIAFHEYMDTLINKDLPPNQIEQKFADCLLQLRKKYLQNLAEKKAEILALEAESDGTEATLARMKPEDIEYVSQLREIHTQKGSGGRR
ncbi:MAG TPA: DNA primase [Dehalococcoidales bacterium]|nr:DNA primase [Dehalococcoidales bacterium]